MHRALLLSAVPAAFLSGLAEADPMEVQRCIWRCLASDGPAENPAYHQCVEAHCGDEQGAAAPAPADRRWNAGQRSDGRVFAGADTPDGSAGLYYFCDRTGASEIVVWGPANAPAQMTLVVDAAAFPLEFRFDPGGWYVAPVGAGAPVLVALGQGRQVSVRDPVGATMLSLALSGSSAAIAEALSACR